MNYNQLIIAFIVSVPITLGYNLIQINLGPQHPSTHGVLRIIAFVECETIKSVEPELGLLHRGSEKLIEYRCQNKSLPYFNRLDYVSLLAQEEIQLQAEEKLLNLRISSTGSALRTTMVEISRILNHLLALTTHAIDLGGFTAFLQGFEEREKLMQFYEAVSGGRIHSGILRTSGIIHSLPLYFISEVCRYLFSLPVKLQEIHNLVSRNRI